MLPTRRKGVTPEQAMKNREITKKRLIKAVDSVKNYGKNVVGGAKIVGGVIKNKINEIKGRELNKEFSGKLSNNKTMDMLKRGMQGKKK